jgi:hypothetical protein
MTMKQNNRSTTFLAVSLVAIAASVIVPLSLGRGRAHSAGDSLKPGGSAPADVAQRLDSAHEHLVEVARPCLSAHPLAQVNAGQKDATIQTLTFRYRLVRVGEMDATSNFSVVASTIGDAHLKNCVADALKAAKWRASAGSNDRLDAEDTLRVGELAGSVHPDLAP